MTQSTGIIIGRFQHFELTSLHQKLIQKVRDQHSKVVVFLGSNPAPSNINPLDFQTRFEMFQETYGDSIPVFDMPDLQDDRIWSQELDRRVLELRPEGKVTLYGRALTFIQRYSGRYNTEELEVLDFPLSADDLPSPFSGDKKSFRAGVIHAWMQRFPTVYPTVDVAVLRNDRKELLLARKATETRYRFPGGFTDPTDENFEEAALRELGEECGVITIDEFVYIGSCRINDWRYRDSVDGIITHLYGCDLVGGEPEASDDIAELRWYELERLSEDHFVPEHRELFLMLVDFLEEEQEEGF